MTLTDRINHFRDRINPERAERAAREAGKPEAQVKDDVRKAERRKKLLRSGGAGGGSFGG